MPIYEYQCTDCGQSFEFVQKMDEEALIQCPECGEPTLKKLISASAFHLKGSGWYVTDFKNKAKTNTDGQESKTATAASTGAETKTATKEPIVDSKATEATQKKSDKADQS